jgi:hypothetical protein
MKNLIQKVFKTPPNKLIGKIYFKSFKKLNELNYQIKTSWSDLRSSTDFTPRITTLLDNSGPDSISKDPKIGDYLVKMYCEHRFDLLGSGWVKNSYASTAMGLEGKIYRMNLPIAEFDKNANWLEFVVRKAHVTKSREIFNLIDDEYKPIDWQKDYKSGYRWSSKTWYKRQKYGVNQGADIKVPWELARMQHLPQMAIFATLLPDNKDHLIKEFKNQVLDFIATNPPQMGVSWTCTMDVAIRAANILLAFDIFRQVDSDKILKNDFIRVLEQSMYQHGRHIINNLEYSRELTSNHYLSNICGLAFIASYLECTPEIDCWLAFSVQELISEMQKQFYEDGGNFEASTSYHRLSSEMMVYAMALILGLSEAKRNALYCYDLKLWKRKEPKLKPLKEQLYNANNKNLFPQRYMERLLKSGLFAYHITKPTGEIPQIGDNDSGRFFRLSTNGQFLSNIKAENKYHNLINYSEYLNSLPTNQLHDNLFWDENILDHSTLLSAMSGLFENNEFNEYKKKFPCEYSIIRSLAKDRLPTKFKRDIQGATIKNDIELHDLPFHHQEIYRSERNDIRPFKQNLSLVQFPDSGICVFKSDRIYLSVFTGPNGQNGNGGHAHNDKLSFELNIDGKDIEIDPGTYLYTPIPEMRNLFRSAAAHNGPYIKGKEPNNWGPTNQDLFKLENNVTCTILELNQYAICAQMKYKNIIHRRRIEIQDFILIVDDYSSNDFKSYLKQQHFLYSNGYGKLIEKNAA